MSVGVTHIGGNMFEIVPSGEAILLQVSTKLEIADFLNFLYIKQS